jgi:hypothetical protein
MKNVQVKSSPFQMKNVLVKSSPFRMDKYASKVQRISSEKCVSKVQLILNENEENLCITSGEALRRMQNNIFECKKACTANESMRQNHLQIKTAHHLSNHQQHTILTFPALSV